MILTHGANSIGSGGGENVIGGREYAVAAMPDGHIWLAENLDYKFDGCDIAPSGSPSSPAAWYYNNDEATYGIDGTRKCGLIYNWYAIKLLNDNRLVLCPGWHVPTKTEMDSLLAAVGGSSTAGTKLKAADVSWASSWGGIDEYKFSVLPTGSRGSGSFYDIGIHAGLWTSTFYAGTSSYVGYFDTGASVSVPSHTVARAYSVRLIKDY